MGRNINGQSAGIYCIELEPLERLKQSEQVDIIMVNRLINQIELQGVWKTILPVEATSGWVMDGNHRLNVARRLGLCCLPVVKLYYNDPCVSVFHWSDGQPYCLSRIAQEIGNSVIQPYKTTKHLFYPLIPNILLPLNMLRDRFGQ